MPESPHADRGPVLVCIHGFGGSWRNWSHVMPVLETRYDTYAVRLRGHADGEMLPPDTAPTITALADAIESDLDRAGISRAHLAGNSLGGWLALELAARGRALSVTAFSPAGGWEPNSRATRRLRRLLPPGHALLKRLRGNAELVMATGRVRRALLRLAMERGDRLTVSEASAFLRGSADCPIYLSLLDDILTRPYVLSSIDVPVHIAWGTADRLLPRKGYSERFAQLVPHAEWSELPKAGHVPMFDVPQDVIDTIAENTLRAPAQLHS